MLENSNAFLLATKRRRIAWERVLFVLLVGPAAYQCDRNRGLAAQLDADRATYQSSLQVEGSVNGKPGDFDSPNRGSTPRPSSIPSPALSNASLSRTRSFVGPAKWIPCKLTWYGAKYHRPKHSTASGRPYVYTEYTIAVPPIYKAVIRHGKKKRVIAGPSIPFGTLIETKYGSKVVQSVVTDICPGYHGHGTFDHSDAGWHGLGLREDTKVSGFWRVVR